MSEEGEKVVIPKAGKRGGFDMSFNNLETFTSVKIRRTKVTGPLHHVKSSYFITIKDRLQVRDVLQLGDFEVLYRVIAFPKVTPKGGLYRILRVDGANITQHDIDAIKVGSVAIIKNRKSYEKIFEDFSIFNEE